VSGTGLAVFGPSTINNTNPALSGQITIAGDGTLTLTGITLGVFSADQFGDVTIKADVSFTGAPEPTTLVLLGGGLLVLGAAAHRRGRS
jgi:hypothetical protein